MTNVENYVILCFQVSMAFFFNPDLKYLALFFENVKETGKSLAFKEFVLQSLFESMSGWICNIFFFCITPEEMASDP